ncbi:hypothetical protein K435DRAFT_813698 [Dendrothele bispora CBS 962.96]|uniref:Uncharacterized protein n=1 Tax=Dendrothele bispora (strain CBS 962.96) TaxID=1314807 RepID=A0A4S8KKW6_DENBC|nr:hypothetical protein K435DRAFT_813698 [Dendrothele bispora CBS 962.96]
MDEFYDCDRACKALDDLQNLRNVLKLKQSQSILNSVNDLDIRKYEKPRAYRVVALEDATRIFKCNNHASELQGFYQESLFRLQGVIYERELPPLSNKRVHSSQAPYLRQHIGITGLGLVYMSQAIEHFHQLYAKFERGLASEEIDAWHADQSYKYEGITANSHYFTIGANAAGRQSIPFQDGVDPEGILRRLLGNGMAHTEENSVLYMKATNTGQSKWRYISSISQRCVVYFDTRISKCMRRKNKGEPSPEGENCVEGH